MSTRYRLRSRDDFARLRREGRVYRHTLFHLSVVQNGLTYNRYGYITSKALGKAVVRNRVRRLLREAVRLLHADVQPGFDILLIARSASVGEPLTRLVKILSGLYDQAKLMKGGHE